MAKTTRTRKKLLIKSGLSKNTPGTFCVTENQCLFWWRVINAAAFNGELNPPKEFIIRDFYKGTLGWCKPFGRDNGIPEDRIVRIGIKSSITDKNTFLNVLIHEMVHQWEYQVLGEWDDKIEHGKNFYSWREPLQEMFGIKLQKSYKFS